METPEERIYRCILAPILENHTFEDVLESIDNQAIMNQQQQIITLGFQKFVTKIEQGISILMCFGEWEPLDLEALDIVSMREDQIEGSSNFLTLGSLRKLLNVSSDRIDLYHARIQMLIEAEEFEAASAIALLLITFSPEDPAAWVAYGVAEQLCGRLVRGSHAIVAAIEVGEGSLMPAYYSAQALYHIGLPESAKELLKITLSAAKGDKEQCLFQKLAYPMYLAL